MIIKGFWRFQKGCNDRHFGILYIEEFNKITLELFCDPKENEIENYLYKDFSEVKGLTEKGEKVSLFGYYGRSVNAKEFVSYKIKFQYCYFGDFIEKRNTPFFKYINMKISNLFGWYYLDELPLLDNRRGKIFFEREIYKSSDINIFLKYFNKESDSTSTRKYTVERSCCLKIEFVKKKNVYELLDEIKCIQKLFSLLMLRDIKVGVVENLYGTEPIPKKGKLIIHDGKLFQQKVEIKESVLHYSQGSPKSLQSIFTKWYKNKNLYLPILDLFLSSAYSPDTNRLSNFLSIITAVESWHREIILDKDPKNVENFSLLIGQIEEEDMVKWLKSKSIVLQSVSLPKRLDYVLSKDSFNMVQNKNMFKRICSNIRNSVAHNLPKKMKNITPFDISLAARVLGILMSVMIFEELGFSRKFIEKAIKTNLSFKQIFILKESNNYTKF